MNALIDGCVWPLSRTHLLLHEMANRLGTSEPEHEALHPFPKDAPFREWIDDAASRLGLEATGVGCFYADHGRLLRSGAAFVVLVRHKGELHMLCCLRSNARYAELLSPCHETKRISARELIELIRSVNVTDARTDDLSNFASVRRLPAARQRKLLAAMRERERETKNVWTLRPNPSQPLRRKVLHERLPMRFGALFMLHVGALLCRITAWWLLGRMVLAGNIDAGWLPALCMLLLGQVLLESSVVWQQGRVAISAGRILKEHLLHAMFGLESQAVRRRGYGSLFGLVLETEQVESLTMAGGTMALITIAEVIAVAYLASLTPIAFTLISLLTLTCVLLGWVTVRYVRAAKQWTEARMVLTQGTVERMLGHRTRLAQEEEAGRHSDEDSELATYERASATLDRWRVVLAGVVGRTWLVVGIAALVPTFVSGGSIETLALQLGVVLLGHSAISTMAQGIRMMGLAWVAYDHARELYAPAKKTHTADGIPASEGPSRLTVRNVDFNYPEGTKPVLQDCTLAVDPDMHVLLEGESGSGKSTLAALLGGLQAPTRGAITLGGLDIHTLGHERWRRRVAVAPQFYENHIFSGTLLFNLLMARSWPPSGSDAAEAEELCLDLGLGPLLERMPSGLEQIVGTSGWQLSHGEQSRVFLARALLQNPDVVVLDESLGALDPQMRSQCLALLRERATASVLIAHP